MLLHALGDSAEAVQASRTRHWQTTGADLHLPLIEDYLANHLAHRDRHTLMYVDVFAWVCSIGGTWVATPAAVRGYLRRARAHEQTLRAIQSPAPRGVRPLPNSRHAAVTATT